MKKIMLAIGLCFSIISSVYASDNALDQLNLEIKKILAPIENNLTIANLTFNNMEVDEERANSVALSAYYKKTGSHNIFELKLDNLSYNYGDGTAPTTIIKAAIGFDLTKVLSQSELNQLIPNASEFIENIAKDYTEFYGDAASVKSVVTSTTKNDEGNYVGMTALITGKIDLSKLPEEIDKQYVFATDAAVSVSLNLKTGLSIEAFIVSNPEYIGFEENQEGLKELLEKLLAQDEEGLEFISDIATQINEIATEMVEYSNELKTKFAKYLPQLSK
jgi:hypothetical protein